MNMKFNKQNYCTVLEVRIVDTSVGTVLTGRGMEEPFWDNGNVLCTDWDGSHTGIYICKKNSQAVLKLCAFTV